METRDCLIHSAFLVGLSLSITYLSFMELGRIQVMMFLQELTPKLAIFLRSECKFWNINQKYKEDMLQKLTRTDIKLIRLLNLITRKSNLRML